MQLGHWISADEEKRKLRVEVATLRHALKAQQEARAKLKREVEDLEREKKEDKKRIKELEDRCRELEQQRDRYRDTIFKPNVRAKKGDKENEGIEEIYDVFTPKRKRGGQKGHPGRGRKTPERVDEVRRIYLETCPDCSSQIERSKNIEKHTVEDIPPIEVYRAQVIRYERELQWCKKCKRRVKAKISEVIPKSRFGINVLLYVFIHKYIARSSWDTIVWSLANWYGIQVSKGSLVGMLHRSQKWLGNRYEQILEQIRASPVKHADETGWRVDGINHWLWGFFTKEHAYYTIKESRGKGVPEKILTGSHHDDVLVRDDYAAYKKLPLNHQSCWAHLLRNSSEAAKAPDASTEVRLLHRELKKMYASLKEIIAQPFDAIERQAAYQRLSKELKGMAEAKYFHQDAMKIQTRIANQGINLLTTLLYNNVPLTNNLAERGIRPMVVIRKISGGNRSQEGAKTHSVNMSILQTIRFQQQPIISTLKNYLSSSTLQN
ncbi:MAG: IS66 family transposase [Nitrospinae bacterium]|nr:IS66 family transposase [Nitrospinota bacterium]MBI5750061.1 IS66 family transposase [Nitrospinota bacterium]